MAKQKKKKRSEFSQLSKKKQQAGFAAPQVKVQSVTTRAEIDDSYSGEASISALMDLYAAGRRAAFLNMLKDTQLNDPQHAAQLPELGNMLMKAQDFDSAATVFRAWSELEPGNAKAFNSLGTALVSGNWLEAGQSALSQAVALDPSQSIYQFNMAKLYMVRDMWEQARSMLMNLKHNFPDSKDKAEELLKQFPENG